MTYRIIIGLQLAAALAIIVTYKLWWVIAALTSAGAR